jgi:hypothetical protein
MSDSIVELLAMPGIWVAALSVAAFLVLFWMMRGAPIGQGPTGEGEDAPAAGYRDRVIAAVVFGLVLLLVGGYLALGGRVVWSLPVFALGFAMVLVLVAKNRKHRHGSPALRRAIEISDAVLTATLLAGILIVANVLAFRYGGRAIDFTRERAFSLSPLSLSEIRTLDRPVSFTLFYGRSSTALPELLRVQQLVELYKAANPQKVTITYVNPYIEREKFAEIVKAIPDVGVVVSQSSGGVLVEYGSEQNAERFVLRNEDLFQIPTGEGNRITRFESRFIGEDAITSALRNLREGEKPKVAFTTGHGEPAAAPSNQRVPSNRDFRASLNAAGCEVVDIDLSNESLSKAYSVVIIHAPQTKFFPTELTRLKSFIDGGGRAIILLGSNDAKEGLDELLKSYNIDIGPGIVIDPEQSQVRRYAPEFLIVGASPQLSHPIVDSLAQVPLFFPFTAPLKVRTPGPKGQGTNPAVQATPILRTRRQAWTESDPTTLRGSRPERDSKDEAGPINVAIAVESRAKPGEHDKPIPRLVVFASGAMANDGVAQIKTNRDVLMNAVSWLRGRPEGLGISSNVHIAQTLMIEPLRRGRLIMVPTVIAVITIIGFGLTTYAARRE